MGLTNFSLFSKKLWVNEIKKHTHTIVDARTKSVAIMFSFFSSVSIISFFDAHLWWMGFFSTFFIFKKFSFVSLHLFKAKR